MTISEIVQWGNYLLNSYREEQYEHGVTAEDLRVLERIIGRKLHDPNRVSEQQGA